MHKGSNQNFFIRSLGVRNEVGVGAIISRLCKYGRCTFPNFLDCEAYFQQMDEDVWTVFTSNFESRTAL